MVQQGSLSRHQNPNATGSDKFQLMKCSNLSVTVWYFGSNSPLQMFIANYSRHLYWGTHKFAFDALASRNFFFCWTLFFSWGILLFVVHKLAVIIVQVFTTVTTSTLEQNIVVISFVPICELGVGGTTFATIHARVIYLYCWQYWLLCAGS